MDFEKLAKDNPELQEAYDTLVKLSADEEKRFEYEVREKAFRDYVSQMLSRWRKGKEEGIIEGIEEGIEKGINIASDVSHDYYVDHQTPAEIAQARSISLDKVMKILKLHS